MSRSYKHTPILKDNGDSKKRVKKIASHVIRQKLKFSDEIGQYNNYKKHYCSWLITDRVCRWTEEEAVQMYFETLESNIIDHKRFPTLESWLNYWRKCMYWK